MTNEFASDAAAVASETMALLDPNLSDEFSTVIGFLADNPASARSFSKKPEFSVGTEGYIQACATKYATARLPRYPAVPSTIPDPAVSVVLESFFDLPDAELARIKREHQLSMAAENLVGDLLERYIASNLEEVGWVWCAGEFVTSIDFVKPVDDRNVKWKSLQVKNRDNSENSSSSRVRDGTTIEKWHRTKSKTGATRWSEFPADAGHSMSESRFLQFVHDYFQ